MSLPYKQNCSPNYQRNLAGCEVEGDLCNACIFIYLSKLTLMLNSNNILQVHNKCVCNFTAPFLFV